MMLVTGGGGVLGTALAAELNKNGGPFKILTRSDVDLRDAEKTIDFFKELAPTVVFHLAGRVHGLMGNAKFPGEMFADNIKINMNVIEASLRANCRRFIGVSTVAIYPANSPLPISEGSIWNGLPHGSELAYGHAKRAMLAQLEAYHQQYGLSYAYPILTNIYGPNDRFDIVNGHVVPSLISKFFEASCSGGSVEIWGSGNPLRDFIHASDAARAIVLIAGKHQGPINVASGRVVRIRDLVNILQFRSGLKKVTWDSSKPDGQAIRGYDVSLLEGLGFSTSISLEEGLSQTYDWYKTNFPNVRTS